MVPETARAISWRASSLSSNYFSRAAMAVSRSTSLPRVARVLAVSLLDLLVQVPVGLVARRYQLLQFRDRGFARRDFSVQGLNLASRARKVSASAIFSDSRVSRCCSRLADLLGARRQIALEARDRRAARLDIRRQAEDALPRGRRCDSSKSTLSFSIARTWRSALRCPSAASCACCSALLSAAVRPSSSRSRRATTCSRSRKSPLRGFTLTLGSREKLFEIGSALRLGVQIGFK